MKKRITNLLLLTMMSLFCVTVSLSAQSTSRSYLKGAVPVEDGEVVFRKTFNVANLSQDSLMNLTRNWIESRDNEDEDRMSRVLIFNEEEGSIVGGCREKLVFRSAFLLLDQADMNYYLNAVCTSGNVEMSIFRIRYTYEDDQRYTAEELITDEVSLDKEQKKIIRTSRKWRIKTIDFANDLFEDFSYYLFSKS